MADAFQINSIQNLVVVFLLSLFPQTSFAHEADVSKAEIGLEEKLGSSLPEKMVFRDEQGRSVDLKAAIDKPTIIAPVYLGCVHACPMLLTGLAEVLGKIDLVKPGRDFQVMTLSFDDKDTPAIALDKKRNYLKAAGIGFPDDAWKFLTGDGKSIKRFTDSIGFQFQRDGEHEFSHPVTLVIVAPGGKVVRYLEGVTFLPFEVTMALTEASEGRTGSPARKALMYCFSYDPLKKSYVFNILKVTGTAMILFVAGFFAYLMITARKKQRE
jgi:protein SCO1/2